MTGWTLFFTMVGVAFLTAQLFRIIDLIEAPPSQRRTAHRAHAMPRRTVCQLLESMFGFAELVIQKSEQLYASSRSAFQEVLHRREAR